MLFKKPPRNPQRSHHNNGRRIVRKVVVIEETIKMPIFMKHLSLFCNRHPLPLPMRFLAESVSNKGEPMAVYRCTDAQCRYREGWVADHHSGRPWKLWGGLHDGR